MPETPSILLVDDDENFLQGLARAMHRRGTGWEMLLTTRVDEAMELLRTRPIDAVVLDVKMPGIDGLELLGSIRAAPLTRDVPVTILTGCEDYVLKRRALDLGATDLLNKPVNVEDLLARIRSMLRLKSYQDELKSLNQSLDQRVRQRTADLERAKLEIIWRLAKAGEFRDEDTGEHVARVGCYCQILSEQIGMVREFVESIFLTSPLHDIGKIGIPDQILLKQGRLTAAERKLMESHCEIGARILRDQALGERMFLTWRGDEPRLPRSGDDDGFMDMAHSIALYHHERWDGTGYPHGLAGETIPLAARIVKLADVYDALSSDRPYKPAYPHERVMEIMRAEQAGAQFDPVVYEAFEARQEDFRQVRVEVRGESLLGAAR